MKRNNFGFPVVDKRLADAQKQAAEARSRNFPAPCACEACVNAERLPSVQRILAKWTPLDRP